MTHLLLTTVCAGIALGCAESAPAPAPAEPLASAAPAVAVAIAEPPVDSARVLADLRFLSSPALEGRRTGTPGNAAARAYIASELYAAGVEPLGAGWTHAFAVGGADGAGSLQGVNVLGVVRGTETPDRYLVVTAHFDHLGRRGDEVYLGADDNASGSAALLEIARALAADPPRHSVVIAALDAEEMGLQGARAFIADPPIPLESVVMNVNMDMVGRNDADELYVAGTHHSASLTPLVEAVAARSGLTLLRGHDTPDLPPGDDWTSASDHGPFHQAGIPFAYFGVEDHPDYHRPTDTFGGIQPAFFVSAVSTVLDFVREADARADEVQRAR